MVLLFCKAGGNPNYMVEDSTCLMRACCSGQDMCVDILHRYGARLDERSKKSGRTALMKASLWGELDCVRALLRAGCDRRCRDFSGIDAAEFARRRRLLDVKYQELVECFDCANGYFARKRCEREALESVRIFYSLLCPISIFSF